MKDKSLIILLGIIAVNLTFLTVNQIGLFPTAYAQSSCYADIQNHDFNIINQIEQARAKL